MALESGPTGWSSLAIPTASYGIQPEFSSSLGIQISRGRGFTKDDNAGSERVVIVTQDAADIYWPGEDPVGKRLRIGSASSGAPWLTVVGVVPGIAFLGPEAIFGDLGNNRMPFVFQPLDQMGAPKVWGIAVRARTDAPGLMPIVRRVIATQQPQGRIAVEGLGDLSAMRSFGPLSTIRFNAGLVGALASFGLGLALLGIFAVVSEGIDRRRREIAIRSALGAESHHILGLAIRDGMMLTVLGVLAGGLGASLLRETLRSQLIGVEPLAPGLLGAVVAAVLAVALAASLAGGWRALRIAPTIALKDE
jgi:hypothetical protein